MTIAALTGQELQDIRAAIAMAYPYPVSRLRAVTLDPSNQLLVVFESDRATCIERVACQFGAGVSDPTLETIAVVPQIAIAKPSESADFRAVIDRVIKWQGLEIGLEFAPGAVRFPGSHAHKLRSGYGHLRGHFAQDDREAADCYVHPRLIDSPDEAPTSIWKIQQLDPATGEHNEFKWMLGYESEQEATDAYLAEMPSRDYFGGIQEAELGELNFADPPEPIQPSGELLDNSEWDAIANIQPKDIEDALDNLADS